MSISLLIAEALHTRKEFDISLWRQLRQAVSLRYGPSRLDPWEYFFFRVFLDCYSAKEKKRFVGWRREMQLDRLANAQDARDPANNKLLCHTLLAANDLPQAKIVGIYCKADPQIRGPAILNDADNLALFLRNTDGYPLFVKPVHGAHGEQTFALHDLIKDELILGSGERLGITDFIVRLAPARKTGVLFQELLHSAPDLETVCGPRLTSVRIIVIMTAKGPEILSAVWRVPTGTNITDNFNCGRDGNIIAGIELGSGHLQRIVRGVGWKILPLDHHPDTGNTFTDLRLPDWPATRLLCLAAAGLLPNLSLQHWDIALTDRGPVILEINVEGGMRTHQIVQQRGIYDARLQRALEPGN